MNTTAPVKAVLFDLDGVLYVGRQLIAGAAETIDCLRSQGVALRYVTNTTTKPQEVLWSELVDMGLPVAKEELFSAPQVAKQYLSQRQHSKVRALLQPQMLPDFSEYTLLDWADETPADVVLVGDVGDAWSYALLNRVFNDVMNGARLVALHKGRYWQTEQGLALDIGAFIAGVEYATDTQALVLGKPSPDYFHAVLASTGVSANQAVMIGDDIDSDVGGAQAAGLSGVLVRTGKYRKAYADRASVTPNGVIDSVAQLPQWLGIPT